jgi:hypothetical protein
MMEQLTIARFNTVKDIYAALRKLSNEGLLIRSI